MDRDAQTAELRTHLADKLGGSWTEDGLQVGQVNVYLSVLVVPRSVGTDEPCIELYEIYTDTAGAGVGTRIVEALREIADGMRLPLVIGPCRNVGYWTRPSFSWLTIIRGADGVAELFMRYMPAAQVDALDRR